MFKYFEASVVAKMCLWKLMEKIVVTNYRHFLRYVTIPHRYRLDNAQNVAVTYILRMYQTIVTFKRAVSCM